MARLRGMFLQDDVETGGREPAPGIVSLLLVIGLPLAFLGLALAVHAMLAVPIGDITREPTLTLGGPPLTGFQSNLGVLVLWSGAIISLSAFAVLRRATAARPGPGFFLGAGLITAYLALDDLLMLHDDIFVELLGQNERRTMLVYAVVVGLFLVRYRGTILSSRSLPLLVVAIVLMGTSTAIDQLAELWADQEMRLFVEDGLKLVGITAWTAYFARRAYYAVTGGLGAVRASS